MSSPPPVQRRTPLREVALAPLILVAILWLAEIVDAISDEQLDRFGIQPREADGLTGVVLAPFLHAGFGHLMANTVALLVLGLLVAVTTGRFWSVALAITVLGGLGVWLLAAPGTVHVGASGLVYGLAAYLVAHGIFTRKPASVVVAVLVVFLYGGMIFGVLPGQPGISWQSHLFGAVAGAFVAWLQASRKSGSVATRK